MTYPFVEDVVQAVIDELSAGLPTQLLAVANKYAAADLAVSRSVPLPAPTTYLYGEHDDPGAGVPVVCVWSPESSLTKMYVANSATGSADYEIVVLVDVHLQSDSEETVERQYGRYGEAIYNVIYPTQSLGGAAITVKPKHLQRVKTNGTAARVLRWELAINSEVEY